MWFTVPGAIIPRPKPPRNPPRGGGIVFHLLNGEYFD